MFEKLPLWHELQIFLYNLWFIFDFVFLHNRSSPSFCDFWILYYTLEGLFQFKNVRQFCFLLSGFMLSHLNVDASGIYLLSWKTWFKLLCFFSRSLQLCCVWGRYYLSPTDSNTPLRKNKIPPGIQVESNLHSPPMGVPAESCTDHCHILITTIEFNIYLSYFLTPLC